MLRTCAKCGKVCERFGQGYCNEHHAEYQRSRRQFNPMTEAQRKHANARSYIKEYVRRGKIKKGCCAICFTDKKVEAHHFDYNYPLHVIWLCRKHHLELHGNERTFPEESRLQIEYKTEINLGV